MSKSTDSAETNPVVERKKIDETIVSLTVPTRGNVEYRILQDGTITFYSFKYSVKGGSVFAHVRAEQPELYRGQRIRARVEVWRKRRQCGENELFIDLYPVDRTPVNKMCVTGTDPIPRRYRGRHVRIHTVPQPMSGFVIFAPIG